MKKINAERLKYIRSLYEKPFHNCFSSGEALSRGYVLAGKNVLFQEGVIVGVDGFGYERAEDGTLVKFPHFGTVDIKDDVEIYAHTVICRGSVRDTVIGKGTKVANNCTIGHNVQIGEHCLIMPRVILAGSCEIGDKVEIGMGSCIDHGVKISANAVIGAMSYVRDPVPPDELWYGVPAKFVRKVE